MGTLLTRRQVRLGDQLSVYDVFFEWYKQENEHSYCDDQGKLCVDRRLIFLLLM